jgi:NADPH:quinone reductase
VPEEPGPPERQVAIASTGDLKVSFDLVDFYHREGRLFGVDTLKLGFAESASVLRGLFNGKESGDFKPPELATVTLDEAVSAPRPSTLALPEKSR